MCAAAGKAVAADSDSEDDEEDDSSAEGSPARNRPLAAPASIGGPLSGGLTIPATMNDPGELKGPSVSERSATSRELHEHSEIDGVLGFHKPRSGCEAFEAASGTDTSEQGGSAASFQPFLSFVALWTSSALYCAAYQSVMHLPSSDPMLQLRCLAAQETCWRERWRSALASAAGDRACLKPGSGRSATSC